MTEQAQAETRPRDPSELGPQGRRTRQRLLDAGRVVIAERGIHDTRVDDIVDRAGTSHGTFYLYFSNKDEMLQVLREDCEAALRALADELPALAQGDDGRREFRAWIGKFDALYREHGPVIAAHLQLRGGPGADDRPDDVLAVLQDRIADAIVEAECEVTAEVAALAIVSMLERYSFQAVSNGHPEPDEDALETLARLSHSGLFA